MKSPSPHLISTSIFFFWQIYTEYISKFDNALKALEELKKSAVFLSVLQEFESQAKCANIPIAGYMLDVVQRITRYKLLVAGVLLLLLLFVVLIVQATKTN